MSLKLVAFIVETPETPAKLLKRLMDDTEFHNLTIHDGAILPVEPFEDLSDLLRSLDERRMRAGLKAPIVPIKKDQV